MKEKRKITPLRRQGIPYEVFGSSKIEQGARLQMNIATKLPSAVAAALLPDAHQGYGLPIGGVLATVDTIIPYGVGVDIGCRMALTIFAMRSIEFPAVESFFKEVLVKNTVFGAGKGFHGKDRADHLVLDSDEFSTNVFVRKLKDKAWEQLGSSGGGNHFAEWGFITFEDYDSNLDIPAGTYVALLTHSGSRGLGASIANHYTALAKQLCPLPREASNLAYLDMKSEEGQDYWKLMHLAGDYASACHEVIHHRITQAIGVEVLASVENHHNFAWIEQYKERDVIVHRKGATPAGEGVMGIIPGSMVAPGFLVRGKGNEMSVNSAAHGAGRQMSRTQANKTVQEEEVRKMLSDFGVQVIGGGRDEAPMVYKDIYEVMQAQEDLVDIVAVFKPKIVRMASDGSRED